MAARFGANFDAFAAFATVKLILGCVGGSVTIMQTPLIG
jgi:hypothetical protein